MVTAPHPLAAQAGHGVLKEGGSAVEAMVAMAAAIAVAYPHMTGLGGDGFWLIAEGGSGPIGVSACGQAARLASIEWYRDQAGVRALPARGPLSCLTVPGTVAGWHLALQIGSQMRGYRNLPLDRLLQPAIQAARQGVDLSPNVTDLLLDKWTELAPQHGFEALYGAGGTDSLPKRGTGHRNPALAETLDYLARHGLEDFYTGDLAAAMADELADLGSPLRESDFHAMRASIVECLKLRLKDGTRLYNHPPPTQGLASLALLGLWDRLDRPHDLTTAQDLHLMVEATKQAFALRDVIVTDPMRLPRDPQEVLDGPDLDRMASAVDPTMADDMVTPPGGGDTIWMGAVDAEGNAVSFIQSLYWGFGSGVTLGTGVTVQNRGLGFSLDPQDLNALAPFARPFHTLNPAMALLPDGRHLTYGTMGGEGQPQTQAAIFARMLAGGQSPAAAIAAPRWLWGRTWGESSATLKLETRLDEEIAADLIGRGHMVEWVEAYSQQMGHAGAIVQTADGDLTGGSDPRADGCVMVVEGE
ncbi:MAG: oxamate amidohydrolase [Alphaproteobacteria bacterium]